MKHGSGQMVIYASVFILKNYPLTNDQANVDTKPFILPFLCKGVDSRIIE